MIRQLRSDDRGAIMLVALAFAVFGVAMLYYAIGIGETVLLRERMQDAADGGALTAAVVHARSMNFLVLLNIIMAALIAILVAFKLVETLATIGIIVAAALAWFTGGSTLAAIPPLKAVASEMKSLYDTTKDPIFQALEVLHETADAVAAVSPSAARGVASGDLKAHWQPLVHDELIAMHDDEAHPHMLPVEDDTFDKLCEEGGHLAGGLALKPFDPILKGRIGRKVRDELKGALGDLTGGMSDWFCGESGGPPPSPPPKRVNNRYPRTDAMDHCKKDELTPDQVIQAAQDPKSVTTEACEESAADTEAAQPDDTTGECRDGQDCSESGPYELHARIARDQCDPTRSPAPFRYSYQTRSGSVTYRYTKAGWVRGLPEYEPLTFVRDQSRPPCGPKSVGPSVAVGYEKQVRERSGGDVQSLCSSEVPPLLPPADPRDPHEQRVDFVEVRHMLLCEKSELEPVEVGDAKAADDSGDPKYPKRVRGDLKLGSDTFQMRVVVRTEQATAKADRAVKLSLWGATSPEGELPPGATLRSFAFAQAEYFYDGTEGADAWMWNMNWRARLRHFRLPEVTDDRTALWTKVNVAFFKQAPDFEKDFKLVEAEIAH
jgi:hypothetical protein